MTMNILTNPKKLRGFERYVKVDNVSRRSILKGLGLAGGFVLAAPVMSRPGFAAYQTGADKMPHGTVVDPRVFVAIAPDGIVTIVAHRAEMGTGVRTSLPMIVAEEMEADWSRVRIQQAHGDEVKFGNQDTDGSRSTRHYLIPMRQIGASARTMLEGAAAKRWGVPATEVKAVNHEVVHSASGRKLGFGELAVLLVSGPIMIGGGFAMITGQLSTNVMLASLPYGLGVMTILVGKHIDQIDFDSGRNIHTLPVVIGEKIARVLNIAAICAIYAIIAALIGFGRLTPFAAIVVFALPRAVRAITLMSRPRPTSPPHGYIGWPLWYHRACLGHNRLFGWAYIGGLAGGAVWHALTWTGVG